MEQSDSAVTARCDPDEALIITYHDMISELEQAGFEVGAHGLEHLRPRDGRL